MAPDTLAMAETDAACQKQLSDLRSDRIMTNGNPLILKCTYTSESAQKHPK
jgi:hypothetical protein